MKSGAQMKRRRQWAHRAEPIPGATPRVHADDRLATARVHTKSRAPTAALAILASPRKSFAAIEPVQTLPT